MFSESLSYDNPAPLSPTFIIIRTLSVLTAVSNRIALYPQGSLGYLVSVPSSTPKDCIRRTLGREKSLHPLLLVFGVICVCQPSHFRISLLFPKLQSASVGDQELGIGVSYPNPENTLGYWATVYIRRILHPWC